MNVQHNGISEAEEEREGGAGRVHGVDEAMGVEGAEEKVGGLFGRRGSFLFRFVRDGEVVTGEEKRVVLSVS